MNKSNLILPSYLTPMRAGATDMTRISDVVVPEIFSGYVQTKTTEKSRLIQSGALVIDERLSANLAGGGATFEEPFYHDLLSDDGDHAENVSNDSGNKSTPDKIQAAAEAQVRMSRNKSWGSADLVKSLAGNDPMEAIANRVSDWRVRRLQKAWLATMAGVFATNDVDPVAGSTHKKQDLTLDISAGTGDAAKFSSSAFIQATGLLGDSMEVLTMVMMHSVVYQRLQLLNLIDYIPDARGETMISTYMGREVIVDDGMPTQAGKFHTYLVGSGATAMGVGSPKVPVEIQRNPDANNGGGEEILYNRWEWIIHPVGHRWVGSSTMKGGPSNTELATSTSFNRVFRERKMIKIARLITKEL